MEELFQFPDLPSIYLEPNGPLGPDRFFHPSSQRQWSLSLNDYNPRGRSIAHDMMLSHSSPETGLPEFPLDRFMSMYSNRARKAPKPVTQDSWEPTGTYPHSVRQVRTSSPIESYCEPSEGSWSCTSGPLSPPLPISPDLYYSTGYSSVSVSEFFYPEDDYSSRQNHDLLHISASRGRSYATDTFVNLQQVQQCPDTPVEDFITLAGPHSSSSLVLTIDPLVEHGYTPDEDLSLDQSDFQDPEMSIKHGQLACQHGIDSGFVSSATDEDFDMDPDADAEADVISDDGNGNNGGESDYEPESFSRTRRQTNSNSRQGRGSSGKGTIPKPFPTSSGSRRPSLGSKVLGHRVSKSSGSTKSTRSLVSKPKSKEASSTTRPFPCLLNPICSSTFSSKNEWKRHISTRHLARGLYRCPFPDCIVKRPSSSSVAGGATPASSSGTIGIEDENTIYNDFNRKDLFTQHLRRMHMPDPSRSPPSTDKFKSKSSSMSTFKESTRKENEKEKEKDKAVPLPPDLLALHTSAYFQIRQPPTSATCHVCHAGFEGDSAWERRIECLGSHFGDWARTGDTTESGNGNGGVKALELGPDQQLIDWMLQEGLLVRSESGSREVSFA